MYNKKICPYFGMWIHIINCKCMIKLLPGKWPFICYMFSKKSSNNNESTYLFSYRLSLHFNYKFQSSELILNRSSVILDNQLSRSCDLSIHTHVAENKNNLLTASQQPPSTKTSNKSRNQRHFYKIAAFTCSNCPLLSAAVRLQKQSVSLQCLILKVPPW